MPGLIKVLNSDDAPRSIPDSGQVTIGRGDLADMVIKDAYASRVHCAVEGNEGRFFVSDLGSGNGTKLNDETIAAKTELKEGDRITIGQTTLVFSLGGPAEGAAAPKPRKKVNPFQTLRAMNHALKAGKTWQLGDYQVVARIAKGGMGTVYRAVQQSHGRTVALKVLSPELMSQSNVVERFLREAKTASQLEHRHVVAAYDYGQADGLYYFSMEYVDGTPLSTFLKRKRISESDAVRLALDVVDALEHAAAKHMVHRDVKPGNLMITRDGIVKLCDFGLAKPRQWDGPALTAPGMRVGTPTYMAPEQIKGEEVDLRTDIYSLGATLYRAVTGKRPFARQTPFQVMTAHVTDPLPKPRSVKPDLSPELDAVICKMMEKDPGNRYQTFDRLRAALKEVQRANKARKAEEARAVAPTEVIEEHKPAPAPPTPAPAPEPAPAPQETKKVSESRGFVLIDDEDSDFEAGPPGPAQASAPAPDESDYDIVLDGKLKHEPLVETPDEAEPEPAPEPKPAKPKPAPMPPRPSPIEPLVPPPPPPEPGRIAKLLNALRSGIARLIRRRPKG